MKEKDMNNNFKKNKKINMKKLVLILGMLMCIGGINAQNKNITFPEPCSIKGPKWGKDSVKAVQSYSIFRENMKQWTANKQRTELLEYSVDSWRFLFNHAPLASPYIYIDGQDIVEYLIKKNEANPDLRQKYIDTLMMVFDKRIEAFGCESHSSEGFVLGRKALSLLKYRPENTQEILATFRRSIDLGKENTEPAIVFNYYHYIVNQVNNGQMDTLVIFEEYDRLYELMNKRLIKLYDEYKDNPADSTKYERSIKNVQAAIINMDNFMEPFANCSIIIDIYNKKFEQNKQNTEFLRRLTNIMEKKSCDDNQLYFKASEQLYALDPSPASAFSLAKSFIKAKRYNDAIKYATQAAENFDNADDKFDAYMVLAEAYRLNGQYPAAKNAAMKASNIKPNSGKPYIFIGDLYMITANSCGDNPISKRAGFWAAYDQYNKAKKDPEFANIASKKASEAYSYFPKTEDLFFYGFYKGDAYTINCWYTETTTIRAID
jgi:tetratricopeptide (TPR) repeat protein